MKFTHTLKTTKKITFISKKEKKKKKKWTVKGKSLHLYVISMCDKQKQNKNKKIHNNNSKKCKINRDNIPKKTKKNKEFCQNSLLFPKVIV